ncbi:MAG: 2Fe-2S iron-sulfur cluster binding domain-containing protein [Sulfobacillus thermotolerans]|nr:2Fe-2S iron-sulfur cluster binding domain-containing protein [Sulfobacillus thermotolerans]
MAYIVRLEPIGVEMEVNEGETVLRAAFRQGIMLMHGCKEGQCASCKSILLEGDMDLLKHSTFALPDYEREQDYILLCRTVPYSDLVIELLNYDEDLLKLAIPVKSYPGRVQEIVPLTHDMRLLRVALDNEAGFRFFAGQYADITSVRHQVTRSYSMASTPRTLHQLEFLIKVYPGGAFSSLLDGDLRPDDPLTLTGPYGICCRRDGEGPVVLVGGGSGMAPLLSIVRDMGDRGIDRPIWFFYGARNVPDLICQQEIVELGGHFQQFTFVPALSAWDGAQDWHGETGYIHEVVHRWLTRGELTEADAYVCGPPPLIDAVIPVLRMKGIDVDRIYFDKFFPASPIEPTH